MGKVVTGASVSLDGFIAGPIPLDGPTVIEGTRVTHLRYTVRRAVTS